MLVVSLSSPPTHHELVADIMWNSGELLEQVVEVRRERGEFVTTIFSKGDGQAWEFSLAEFQGALTSAGSALSGRLDA